MHRFKGVNSRMDELQAAVLRIKLRDLDRANARRVAIAERFAREISNPSLVLPKAKANHVYQVLTAQRLALQRYVLGSVIQPQLHYPLAPHQQKAYNEWLALHFPITEKIAAQELSIPCNQSMTDDDVSKVIAALNAWNT